MLIFNRISFIVLVIFGTKKLEKGVIEIMDIHAYKLELMQKVMAVKQESLLKKLNSLLEEEMVVGYTSEGQPLTKEVYDLRLEKAENEITLGETTSQEELEAESENW